MKLKLGISVKILTAIEKCNYSTKSTYYDDSNKLVIGETAGVAIEEFVGFDAFVLGREQ